MPPLALREYGLAGNEYSSALISRFGSVDWLALPWLDSRGQFSSYFNERTGGRFQILPEGEFKSEFGPGEQAGIVPVFFETPHGKAIMVSWMPPERPTLLRRIEVLQGSIPWQVHCSPRIEANNRPSGCERFAGGILFRGPRTGQIGHLQATVPLSIGGDGHTASARFSLKAGESALFSWAWGRTGLPAFHEELTSPRNSLEFTHNFLKSEAAGGQHVCPPQGCPFAGPWHHLVVRTQQLFRLVQNRWGGLLAEGIIPSQTEFYGGEVPQLTIRAWTRDLAMAMQTLANFGMLREAKTLFLRMTDLFMRDSPEGLQPAYSLDGGHSEAASPDSEPYSRHFHFDVHAQFLLAAAEYHRLFGELPPGLWPLLKDLTDSICRAWRRPDRGAWELGDIRSDHFVSSKIIAWAGIDRACRLAAAHGEPVSSRWQEERRILHRTICEQGYDPSQKSFVRSFSDRELDAATLMIPLLGFLPPDDPRVVGTITAIQSHLSDGVFIHRYRERIRRPQEPALFFSFLFITALTLLGRTEEASDRLAELCSYATPQGYFGERVDLRTGYTIGLFPCTESHLALTQAILHVASARGRTLPFPLSAFAPPAEKAASLPKKIA